MKVFYLDEEEDPIAIGEIIYGRSFVFYAPEGVTDEASWWEFLADKELELEDYTAISHDELKQVIDKARGNKSLLLDVGHGHGLWQDDKKNTFAPKEIP